MKRSFWDGLTRWLLTWLVCFAADLGLGELLRTDVRWWLAVLALLLWCALLAVAERLGHFWAMLTLLAVALGLSLLLADREQLTEAALAVLSRGGTESGCGELVLLLFCAALALPLSAGLRCYGVRAALSLGWAALWITAALLEWPLPRPVLAAMIPLLLLTLTETVGRFLREPEPKEALKRALLLSLFPSVLLLAVLPASAEPYGYPLLHSVAETVEELWHDAETALRYRRQGDREFGLSFNGISDKGTVGEGSEDEAPSIIYAKPGRATDEAVYLFGNAWNRFDGRSWSSTLQPKDTEYLNWKMDTAEHVYALWRLLSEEERQEEFADYFRPNSVYLDCYNLNVRTMFSTMNATRVFTDVERFPYADIPTGSLFDYVQEGEVWYRIHYLEPNARTRSALIAAAEGTVYDPETGGPVWSRVTQDFPAVVHMDLRETMELEIAFARREALIRGVYLDSTGVSDRAAALAEEITADCGSDAERVAAIASYLRENYSYTLRPAPVPEDANFLDWMLFEHREGYCSWFATAAAMLSRSIGVPARYVQGYRGVLGTDVFTPILPREAHAWCECYISGYGWVTVEATPGFGGEGAGWLTAAEEQALSGGESEDAKSEEQPGDADGGGENPADQPGTGSHGSEPVQPEPEPEGEPARFLWLPTLLSVLLPAALLGTWLWLRMRRKRRYAQADPAARLMMDLERLLRDLRGKGYPRRPEESLREYFTRLPWHFLLASEAEAMEMAELYDRSFFAQKPPSEAELARHRAFAARFRPRTLRQWMIWFGLR